MVATTGSLCLVSFIHLASVSCSSFLASLEAFCLSFKREKDVLVLFVFSFWLFYSRQNFMRNEALLVNGGWEVAAVTWC